MGHISRRLQYQPASRRLTLPGAFMTALSLEPGATVYVLFVSGERRLILSEPEQRALITAAALLPSLQPLQNNLQGIPVVIGSGGRIILPRALEFETRAPRLELGWTLHQSQLLIEVLQPALLVPSRMPETDSALPYIASAPPAPDMPPVPHKPIDAHVTHAHVTHAHVTHAHVTHAHDAHAHDAPASPSQNSVARPSPSEPTPDVRRGAFRFAPIPDGLVLPGPVQTVPLFDIHGFDPDLPPVAVDPGLEEDIALQGMLRPVVLCGPVPHRVLDGRKRLQVALQLQLTEVPAIVLAAMSREEQARLRYLLETTSDRWNIARQLRVLSRLHLNGASLEQLAGLLRRNRRTIQRYLRIAVDPTLIAGIEQGSFSLQEAEARLRKGRDEG